MKDDQVGKKMFIQATTKDKKNNAYFVKKKSKIPENLKEYILLKNRKMRR